MHGVGGGGGGGCDGVVVHAAFNEAEPHSYINFNLPYRPLFCVARSFVFVLGVRSLSAELHNICSNQAHR